MPPTLTPRDFVAKWSQAALKERAGAQERAGAHEHFIDVCRLVGHPTPAEADPTGQRFAFEAGASRFTEEQGDAIWIRDDRGFDAYGWPHDLTDDEILERLLALNLERAGENA